MKSQLHYLSASHCAAPVTFGLELPVMCTVCAVLPISLTKVNQLRTSTLGYVIATPLPFRVALRRAGGIRFTVAGDAYRLRRTAYAVVGCQIAIYPLGKTGVGYAAGPFCCGACQQQQLCRSCAFPAQGCGRSPLPWVAAQLL